MESGCATESTLNRNGILAPNFLNTSIVPISSGRSLSIMDNLQFSYDWPMPVMIDSPKGCVPIQSWFQIIGRDGVERFVVKGEKANG